MSSRSKFPALTDEEKRKALALYDSGDGESLKNIRNILGTSDYRLRSFLSEHGFVKDPCSYEIKDGVISKSVKAEIFTLKQKVYDCKCPGCGKMYKRTLKNWSGTGTPRIRCDNCTIPQAGSGLYNGEGISKVSHGGII